MRRLLDAMFVCFGSDPTNVVVLAFDSFRQVDGVKKAKPMDDSYDWDFGVDQFNVVFLDRCQQRATDISLVTSGGKVASRCRSIQNAMI